MSIDEVFTDKLHGQSRVQISVLHYRWRTEEFRKVSAGFLGIIAMVNVMGKEKTVVESDPPPRIRREQPLQINTATALEIYKIIEPQLWPKIFVSRALIRSFGWRELWFKRKKLSSGTPGAIRNTIFWDWDVFLYNNVLYGISSEAWKMLGRKAIEF